MARREPRIRRSARLWISASALAAFLSGGCSPDRRTVVVYTSVDQPYSEPVLAEFERQSGIRVQAVYDLEAAKTTGLVNRLIAERDRPQADVFWNGEVIQTIRLGEAGILQEYRSPLAEQIPTQFRDADGRWTGVCARARVLIVNTERVPDWAGIDSLYDLIDPAYPGPEVAIAYPLFGTTATHAAALFEVLGAEQGLAYFEDLAQRGAQVVDGNSVVRDLVASGQASLGLTDTDDACGAVARGQPVAVVLPDQQGIGTLVIPGTVAMIEGAPHPQEAQALIDYLLTEDVERTLIESGFAHIPLHSGLTPPAGCLTGEPVVLMTVDFDEVSLRLEMVQAELRDLFLR